MDLLPVFKGAYLRRPPVLAQEQLVDLVADRVVVNEHYGIDCTRFHVWVFVLRAGVP
jgi:hypothetical protein